MIFQNFSSDILTTVSHLLKNGSIIWFGTSPTNRRMLEDI